MLPLTNCWTPRFEPFCSLQFYWLLPAILDNARIFGTPAQKCFLCCNWLRSNQGWDRPTYRLSPPNKWSSRPKNRAVAQMTSVNHLKVTWNKNSINFYKLQTAWCWYLKNQMEGMIEMPAMIIMIKRGHWWCAIAEEKNFSSLTLFVVTNHITLESTRALLDPTGVLYITILIFCYPNFQIFSYASTNKETWQWISCVIFMMGLFCSNRQPCITVLSH